MFGKNLENSGAAFVNNQSVNVCGQEWQMQTKCHEIMVVPNENPNIFNISLGQFSLILIKFINQGQAFVCRKKIITIIIRNCLIMYCKYTYSMTLQSNAADKHMFLNRIT